MTQLSDQPHFVLCMHSLADPCRVCVALDAAQSERDRLRDELAAVKAERDAAIEHAEASAKTLEAAVAVGGQWVCAATSAESERDFALSQLKHDHEDGWWIDENRLFGRGKTALEALRDAMRKDGQP